MAVADFLEKEIGSQAAQNSSVVAAVENFLCSHTLFQDAADSCSKYTTRDASLTVLQ